MTEKNSSDDPLVARSCSGFDSVTGLFTRAWAAFGLILFGSTWRLWTPQEVYPQVPVLEFIGEFPSAVDWIAVAGMIASLTLILFYKPACDNRLQSLFAVFTICLLILLSLDQHRFQPWAWHWFVFSVIFAIAQRGEAIYWLRWIAISVYIYSAISKLDYQFAHTVGMQMLEAIAKPISGPDATSLSEFGPRIVLLLPIAELLVGLGLIFPVTRVVSGWLAIVLHLALVFVLGPFGLNHYSPVLIWNVFFAIQAYWLFIRPDSVDRSKRAPSLGSSFASVFTMFVVFFPATCSIGVCDHWLAWELYAPRSSRIKIEMPLSLVSELPTRLGPYLKQSEYLPGVVELDLAEWSLNELSVPVYPQARFQLGVARAVGDCLGNDHSLRVTVKSTSNRWTGSREQRSLQGEMEIEKAASRYWLNTLPRSQDGKKPVADTE